MAKKKLGIATIEVNKKFKDRDEAYRYAKNLKEFIRYTCKKKANKGWSAQAIITISNIKGGTAIPYYEQNGKVGRPAKKRDFNKYEFQCYKGDMNTDWHIHILLVSKPSYAFREVIKKYIDRNWNKIPNIYEKEPFDYSKLEQKKMVYKKIPILT